VDDQYQGNHTNETKRIYSLFPPRHSWHRYRLRQRGTRPSTSLNFESLMAAVRALRRRAPTDKWATNLDVVVRRIRNRAMSGNKFSFSKPKIVPLLKEPGGHQFRPLAVFENLEDKIIDRLAARYFRESLDSALLKSCFAFRCRRGKARPPTIHLALNKLLRLNRQYRKKGLYIAECDIKGFFDCVSHKVAMEALRELIVDRRGKDKRHNFAIDNRALAIFESYLKAYSFPINVTKEALPRVRLNDPEAAFKWPKDDLKALHRGKRLASIGVPQGGALSCFIANAVLHSADKELEKLKSRARSEFIYIRYCDDMILVSPNKALCTKALELYSSVLRRKLLPIHPPQRVNHYDKDFWDGKSHFPYLWFCSTRRGAIPWIQFVGYQIRYDGLVRIRRKSFKKHIEKLTQEADKLITVLRRAASSKSESSYVRKTAAQIKHRFTQKLISMSVGRVRLGQKVEGPRPMCWAGGFRGLIGKKVVFRWIRALDRHRERQIRRVARQLIGLPKRPNPLDHGEDFHPYYGRPFSYWGQFLEKSLRG